jgi:hypothetical protein
MSSFTQHIKRGEKRMPAGTPVQVRLQDDERDALDQYRREFLNPPSRGQAARDLIRRALNERGTIDGAEARA